MPTRPRDPNPHPDPQSDPQAPSRGLALLIDHMPIMALLIDTDGCVLQCNDALSRFIGHSPPHLAHILMTPAEDLAQMKAALHEQGSAEFLRDVTRFDGHIRRVHLQAIAVDPRSMMLTLRDITEQHLLEVDHRRCRAAVECCQDLVLIVDHGGGIVYVNPSGEVILGYKPAEMIGLALFDFVHPLDLAQTWQMLQETIEKGQRTHGHIRLMTRQRDVRHLRCLSLALASATNNEILLIGRDSTDQHNLQQALIESQKMEGMGRLARGIAHDFNNLLQLVLGSVQCLENEPDLPDSTREWHETIRTAAERGHKVVEQLQAFSRRDVGVRLPCTIKDMLESLTKLVRPMLSAEIHFRLDIHEPTSVVEVDVGQIQQVLLNLVINAREAISGEGTIDISSAETIRQSKPWALITVRDNGRGIPEEHLSRVFEPFFSTKEHRRGTGLGLAVAYGLIESHGGRIEVESNPGQWTLFRVLLPLAPEGTRALCIDGEQTQVFGNDELILIVDDEPMQRLILKRQLEFLGYDVLLAEDGEHALDLFSDYADEIGCVLLDVVMPRRDGLDTLRAMKSLKPDINIIVTSGLGRDERVTQMLTEGARRFLAKPFRVERLSSILREVLDAPSPP